MDWFSLILSDPQSVKSSERAGWESDKLTKYRKKNVKSFCRAFIRSRFAYYVYIASFAAKGRACAYQGLIKPSAFLVASLTVRWCSQFWVQKNTVSDEILGLERNTTMQPDLEARLLQLNWISFTKERDSFLSLFCRWIGKICSSHLSYGTQSTTLLMCILLQSKLT